MRRIVVSALILFVLGLATISVFVLSTTSLEAKADAIVRGCATEAYPPSCYDTEIPKLMDRGLSMEDAFQVVRLVTERVKDEPNNYFFCHVVAHALSAKETAKDPSAWSSVLGRCPVGMCSNGCLHGVAQERFRGDVLTPEELASALPELAEACSSDVHGEFTLLEHAACRHALGHLAMYVTGADVPRALAACKRMTEGEPIHFLRTCDEGVFMQLYQPLDAEDEALVRDVAPHSAEEAKVYCTDFDGPARSACNTESWPLQDWRSFTTPDVLATFCALTPDPAWTSRCYNDMFAAFASIVAYDYERIVSTCTAFPEEWKGQCFANAASYSIETDYGLVDTAVALCDAAEKEGVGPRCFEELLFYSAYNYKEDSPEFRAFCTVLPEPWQTRCFAHEGNQLVQDVIYSTP